MLSICDPDCGKSKIAHSNTFAICLPGREERPTTSEHVQGTYGLRSNRKHGTCDRLGATQGHHSVEQGREIIDLPLHTLLLYFNTKGFSIQIHPKYAKQQIVEF